MSRPTVPARSFLRGVRRGFTLVELLVVVAILGLVMAAVLSVFMSGNTVGLSGENRAEAQQAARAAMLMEEDLRLAGLGYPPPQPAFPLKITAASPTAITFWADLTNASTALTAQANAGNTTLTVPPGGANGFFAGDVIYLINYNEVVTVTVTGGGGTTINVTVWAPGPTCPAPCSFPAGTQVGRPKLVTYSWDGVNTLFKDDGGGGGPQPLAAGIQAFQLDYFDTNDAPIPPLPGNLANIRRVVITMTAQSTAAQNRGTFRLASSVRPRNL